jgi:starvation-inducible outer membrane lipoprotein
MAYCFDLAIYRKIMIKLIQATAISLLLSACSHIYNPRPHTFKIDAIPEFTAPVEISLVNAQTDASNQLQMRRMGSTVSGNYNAWTDTTIQIATRELMAREATITDGANKRLELAILSARGESVPYAIRYVTELQVKTGDGYEKTYIGDNRSPATLYRAADGSVMRAVAAMFRDPEIIEYIRIIRHP